MGEPVTEVGAPVKILDIRDGGAELSFLDKVNRASAHRLGVPDRIVVVDHTHSLLANHDRFQRLVSLDHVRAVICVAVGPIDDEGGACLRQSAAFRAAGVTLWVGDEWGSRWAGGTSRPQPIVDGPPALFDLVTALGSQELFDEVYAAVRRVPYQVACPGLDILRPFVDRGELRLLRAQVLDEVAGHSAAGLDPPALPTPPREGARIDPSRDVVLVGSSLDRGRAELDRAIETASAAVSAVARPSGLLRAAPRVDANGVRAAFENQSKRIDRMLSLFDRQNTGQGGADELLKLGVPPADRPDNTRLARQLRELVHTELSRGRSLRDLSTRLRRLSNQNMAQGGDAIRAELASARRSLLPENTGLPVPVWAWPVAAVSLFAGLVVAVATWSTASLLVGVVMTLGWAGLLGLFLSRLPSRPSDKAVGSVVLVAGTVLVGAIAYGSALLSPATPRPSTAFAFALVGMAAIMVATMAAWRVVTLKWQRTQSLDETRQAVARLGKLVVDKVAKHVRGVEHSRRLSDAALLLAADTSALAEVYSRRAATYRTASDTPRADAPADLVGVVHGDLVALSLGALDDHLLDIGTEFSLTADLATFVADAELDLTTYENFLDANGVHRRPPMIEDGGSREQLSLALWQRSDTARQILQTEGRNEFVQLCRIGDIRSLDVAWDGVQVLRFAPELAQRVLLDPGSAGGPVITTETETVGALRLVPLGAGRVVHEHPADADTDEGGGSLS